MDLQFRYFALGIFQDRTTRTTELRVIELTRTSRDEAAIEAEELMLKYADDFGLEYRGVLNVYEAGSDMFREYREVFSLTWRSDTGFDNQLVNIVGSP